MPHGTPDFGATAGVQTTYQLTDLAELAARLGSIVTFDRLGDVVFLDSFEDGLVHWVNGDGEWASPVDLSLEASRLGALSVRFPCRPPDALTTGLCLYVAPPGRGKWGLELSFTLEVDSQWIEARIYVWDGASLDTFGVKYDRPASTLYVLGPGAVWVAVASPLGLSPGTGMFHTVKLVYDVDGPTYKRLIVDGVSYPVAGRAPASEPDASSPAVRVTIAHRAQAGKTTDTYLDDVIITQNEP